MSMEDDYADLRMAMEDCDRRSLYVGDGFKDEPSDEADGLAATGHTATTENADEESSRGILNEAMVDKSAIDMNGDMNDKIPDDENTEEYSTLTEDIYSLFFTAKATSPAFFFAMFVFCFQMAIVLLISLDLIDGGADNPLKIPAGVNIEVTIAQALALVLAVATQDDLLTAIIQFHEGYDKRVKETDTAFTFPKWLFACFAQFVIGAAMLSVIFILVVQSKDVIGMMLNFAALAFVYEIDDVAFKLGKYGFVSDAVERGCKQVTEYRFPSRKDKSKWFRRVAFVLILAGLMGGWGYIVNTQFWGVYLPDSIYVQFGDAYEPYLSTFSGEYDFANEIIDYRLVYVERRNGEAYFAYCEEEKAWTFSTSSSSGPCGSWNASSPETKEYDITKAGSPWQVAVLDSAEHVFKYPLDLFTLHKSDCESSSDCSDYGRCENHRCVCDGDRFGRQCEFGAPCPELAVDKRTPPFPNDEVWAWAGANNYTVLRNENDKLVLVYDKPVYVYDYGDGLVDIIMFLGRRWIVADTVLFFNVSTGDSIFFNDLDDFAEHLSNDFHGYFDGYRSSFVSSPMDSGTPTDGATPVNLQWFRVKQTTIDTSLANDADERKPIPTNLLCAACSPGVNECRNFGDCDEPSETCNCLDGFYGELCEAAADCVDVGCRVSGTCNEVTGICDCPQGFAGDLCEVNGTEPIE